MGNLQKRVCYCEGSTVILDDQAFFSRMHTTLQPALFVRQFIGMLVSHTILLSCVLCDSIPRYVGWSVHKSVGWLVGPLFYMIVSPIYPLDSNILAWIVQIALWWLNMNF